MAVLGAGPRAGTRSVRRRRRGGFLEGATLSAGRLDIREAAWRGSWPLVARGLRDQSQDERDELGVAHGLSRGGSEHHSVRQRGEVPDPGTTWRWTWARPSFRAGSRGWPGIRRRTERDGDRSVRCQPRGRGTFSREGPKSAMVAWVTGPSLRRVIRTAPRAGVSASIIRRATQRPR